jgi:hypothetical protein
MAHLNIWHGNWHEMCILKQSAKWRHIREISDEYGRICHDEFYCMMP